MAGNQPTHDLATLLRVTTERPLEPDEFASLETLLLEDSDARAQYRQYMQVDALLQWRLGNAVGSRHITLTDTGSETPATSSCTATPRSRTAVRRWLSNTVVTLAVTLAFWGVFFLFFLLRPNSVEVAQGPGKPVVESAKPVVAELVETFDAVWRGDSPLQPTGGTPLRQGDTLNLAAGLIQLRFESGAQVTLEGPATFVLAEKNAARMELGRTYARAPGDAVGFTIETPAATVVDLGTEFGVMVQRDGTTEVHVFSGLVEAIARTSSQQSSHDKSSLVLEEGKAARIAVDRGEFERLATVNKDFIRLKRPGWIASDQPTAVASSQLLETRLPQYAFDGNTSTRWSSTFADGQWIYIDLGQDYVLRKVEIDWEKAFSKDYKLLIRTAAQGPDNNPANWTQIANVTGRSNVDGRGGRFDDTFNFANANFIPSTGTAESSSVTIAPVGRYLMVYGLTRATEWGHSIWEVNVLKQTSSNEPGKTD